MEKKKYYRCEPDDNGTYKIKEKMLYSAGKNCFATKKEAIEHFKKAAKIALEKYKKIMDGIRKLEEKLGDFSYTCEAKALDDTGLETTMYIEFYVDSYCFRFKQ